LNTRASPIGATKLKLSEIVNWKTLALQQQEGLHNLQRHEQSLLAISQKPSVIRPNFTTYTTPISPMQIAIRIMQGTSFSQPYTKPTTLEPTCHCENLQQSLDPQISDCLQSEGDNRREDSSPVLLMDQEQAGKENLRSRTSSDIQPNSHRSFKNGWIPELSF
jgi:hypothetical protein